MLCRRGPGGRGSAGGQWNGDLGRREPCTRGTGKSYPGGRAVEQEGVWKGTWKSARRILTKTTLFLSKHPSLLSLYITFGTFHHHSVKAIFFTIKSPCNFPIINFRTAHAVRSLIKEAIFEMPFPWTQRMGVQWGMEPFRKIRGKKLLKFQGELMLNFSGSRNF